MNTLSISCKLRCRDITTNSFDIRERFWDNKEFRISHNTSIVCLVTIILDLYLQMIMYWMTNTISMIWISQCTLKSTLTSTWVHFLINKDAFYSQMQQNPSFRTPSTKSNDNCWTPFEGGIICCKHFLIVSVNLFSFRCHPFKPFNNLKHTISSSEQQNKTTKMNDDVEREKVCHQKNEISFSNRA